MCDYLLEWIHSRLRVRNFRKYLFTTLSRYKKLRNTDDTRGTTVRCENCMGTNVERHGRPQNPMTSISSSESTAIWCTRRNHRHYHSADLADRRGNGRQQLGCSPHRFRRCSLIKPLGRTLRGGDDGRKTVRKLDHQPIFRHAKRGLTASYPHRPRGVYGCNHDIQRLLRIAVRYLRGLYGLTGVPSFYRPRNDRFLSFVIDRYFWTITIMSIMIF